MLYVDDLLVTRSSNDLVTSVKNHLQQLYHMKDLGLAQNYLGIKFF